MTDSDPVIITSALSRKVSRDGVVVRVEIYRLEDDQLWTLAVINEQGTSTVWDDLFATDELAFEVFSRTVAAEGMATFVEETGPTLH